MSAANSPSPLYLCPLLVGVPFLCRSVCRRWPALVHAPGPSFFRAEPFVERWRNVWRSRVSCAFAFSGFRVQKFYCCSLSRRPPPRVGRRRTSRLACPQKITQCIAALRITPFPSTPFPNKHVCAPPLDAAPLSIPPLCASAAPPPLHTLRLSTSRCGRCYPLTR